MDGKKEGARMIDEKKLIEEIEKLKQEVNMPVDIVWNNLLKICIDTVYEQPKVGEWIPCSERLPEDYVENLCCDMYGNFIIGFPTTNAVSDTGYAVETDNEIMYDCVAWMPLPEPYKE